MRDTHESDTQNFVSMNQSDKQGDLNNTVKFIAVLMAIELNKKSSNGDALFTTKMKLEMYEDAFEESRRRNSEKLNEKYETKIDKLKRELYEEDTAAAKLMSEAAKLMSDQNADTARRNEFIEVTKAAAAAAAKEAIATAKLSRRGHKSNPKQLTDFPEEIDRTEFTRWLSGGIANFETEIGYLTSSPEKIDVFKFPKEFTNKQKILILDYMLKIGKNGRDTDKLVKCRYFALKVGVTYAGKVQDSGFGDTFNSVVLFKPTENLRSDLLTVLALIKSCRIFNGIEKMIETGIQYVTDGIPIEKKEYIAHNKN